MKVRKGLNRKMVAGRKKERRWVKWVQVVKVIKKKELEFPVEGQNPDG